MKWVGDNTKTARNVILTAGVGGTAGVLAKLQGAVGAAFQMATPTPGVPAATEIPSQIIDVVDAVAPAAGSDYTSIGAGVVVVVLIVAGYVLLKRHLDKSKDADTKSMIDAAHGK